MEIYGEVNIPLTKKNKSELSYLSNLMKRTRKITKEREPFSRYYCSLSLANAVHYHSLSPSFTLFNRGEGIRNRSLKKI